MAITLLCPDPNGNCAADDPNDSSKCSNSCDVSCDCPDDYEYRFLTYAPSYELSAEDQATLESDCGGSVLGVDYLRLTPVDSDDNPIGISDCYDVTDPSARVECYKCNTYYSYPWEMGALGEPGFAAIGPEGSSVFIG